MLTMKTLKTTRTVTYRRPGIPAIILEGKWLTKKYRLEIGDQVDIDYQPHDLRLQKNTKLSLENRRKRSRVTNQEKSYDNETGDQETSEGQSS
jgi:hypothetical protein